MTEETSNADISLYNPYGVPLEARDRDRIISEILAKRGMKAIDVGDLDRLIETGVRDQLRKREDKARAMRVRRFHAAFACGIALLITQIAMLVYGIWVGDWRYAETVLALVFGDIIGGLATVWAYDSI